ncbi:HU family DNA-binding protein [Mycetohabitans rhizoxinica]|uniref:HU family DNA-binding protein n=1 Tax=Mycetohabitans rhizoxinica TaxID=412963 RepID=A0ABZ2PZS7_9BURK
MNKQELIDTVAASTDDSKAAIGEAIHAMLDAIPRAVTAGDAVQRVGFGLCSTWQRAARTSRSPSTGAEIRIAVAKTVRSTAGRAFRDAVNAS